MKKNVIYVVQRLYIVKLCNPTDVILTTSVNNIVAEVVYKFTWIIITYVPHKEIVQQHY